MSLFPEVDEEIKQIKAKEDALLQKLITNSEMYRPSNSSEGDWFERSFCSKCSKDNFDKDIFCSTLATLLGGNCKDIRKHKEYIFCLNDDNFDIKEWVDILK